MEARSSITYKNTVEVLMPLLRVERHDVQGLNGARKDYRHNVFECPKGELCNANVAQDGQAMREYAC